MSSLILLGLAGLVVIALAITAVVILLTRD